MTALDIAGPGRDRAGLDPGRHRPGRAGPGGLRRDRRRRRAGARPRAAGPGGGAAGRGGAGPDGPRSWPAIGQPSSWATAESACPPGRVAAPTVGHGRSDGQCRCSPRRRRPATSPRRTPAARLGIAARLVLHAAAAAAARLLDLARRARETPGPVPQRAAGRAADVGVGDQRGPARAGPAAGHPGERLARGRPDRGGRPGRGGAGRGPPVRAARGGRPGGAAGRGRGAAAPGTCPGSPAPSS